MPKLGHFDYLYHQALDNDPSFQYGTIGKFARHMVSSPKTAEEWKLYTRPGGYVSLLLQELKRRYAPMDYAKVFAPYIALVRVAAIEVAEVRYYGPMYTRYFEISTKVKRVFQGKTVQDGDFPFLYALFDTLAPVDFGINKYGGRCSKMNRITKQFKQTAILSIATVLLAAPFQPGRTGASGPRDTVDDLSLGLGIGTLS
jgi:hypothetical protein